LDENLAAAEIELTSQDLADINEAAAAITIEGARYPESSERMTGI
jgi:hypothetical protein